MSACCNTASLTRGPSPTCLSAPGPRCAPRPACSAAVLREDGNWRGLLLSPFPWRSVSSLTLGAGAWLRGTARCGAGGRTRGAALGAGSVSTGVSTMEPEERGLEAEESRGRELGQQRGLRGHEVSRGCWGSSPRRRGSCVSAETAGMGFQKESTGRGRRVVSGHPRLHLGPCPALEAGHREGAARARRQSISRACGLLLHARSCFPDASLAALTAGRVREAPETVP